MCTKKLNFKENKKVIEMEKRPKSFLKATEKNPCNGCDKSFYPAEELGACNGKNRVCRKMYLNV